MWCDSKCCGHVNWHWAKARLGNMLTFKDNGCTLQCKFTLFIRTVGSDHYLHLGMPKKVLWHWISFFIIDVSNIILQGFSCLKVIPIHIWFQISTQMKMIILRPGRTQSFAYYVVIEHSIYAFMEYSAGCFLPFSCWKNWYCDSSSIWRFPQRGHI